MSWALLLDALEGDCDECGSTAALGAFVPPPSPGPIPAIFLPRAWRLVQRMADLADELERQRAELGRELKAVAAGSAARPGERPHPQFIDTSV